MKTANMPKSDSYREFLIDSLKDPEHAAGFIEEILSEKDPEPALLSNAISKVVEARKRTNEFSPEARECLEKLNAMLTESGGAELYKLAELLDAIGLKLAVTLK